MMVAAYFRARGLELPPNHDAVMRWHPQCLFNHDTKVPCIVSLFRNALTDQPTGIHRTHVIAPELGKAERKALGTMSGSAIKLWPQNGEALAIGEGIENVLAAVKLEIVGPPAWAAAAANNMSIIPVIPIVKQLTILADNDSDKGNGNTGVMAARDLRRRWITAGREVSIKTPTEVGKDFNDILRGQS
jgi:Toprim domain